MLTIAGAWGVYWGASSYLSGIEIYEKGENYAGEYEEHQQRYESTDRPVLIVGSGALLGGLAGLGLGTWWVLSAPQE